MHSGNTNGSSDPHPLNRELPFHIGDWRVDPLNNQLQHADSTVKLEPKVMDVLIYLAMHQGQVVSREDLEEHVWAGRVVTYDAITAAIVKLRKAFHVDGQSEPIIKTISKRGYCLTVPVHQTPPAAEATSTAPMTTEAIDRPLPEDMRDPTPVTSTQPSPATKRTLLLGAVIAIAVVIGAVYFFIAPNNYPPSPTPSAPSQAQPSGTTDPEALMAFNAGWKKYNEQTPAAYKVAIPLIQRAIVLDPDYGEAHAALAAIYWNTWRRSWHIQLGTSPLIHTMELTNASLRQAISHPTALAYQVSSEMLYTNRRYEDAIEEAQKAIALEPNNPVGYAALANAQVYAGLPKQAKASIDKAMQLDPTHPPEFLFTLGLIDYNRAHFDKAVSVLEQAVRANPQNHLIYVPLIAAYGQLGELDKVPPLLKKVNQLRKSCQLPLLNVSSPVESFFHQAWPFKNAKEITRLQDGLRAAGLPEY